MVGIPHTTFAAYSRTVVAGAELFDPCRAKTEVDARRKSGSKPAATLPLRHLFRFTWWSMISLLSEDCERKELQIRTCLKGWKQTVRRRRAIVSFEATESYSSVMNVSTNEWVVFGTEAVLFWLCFSAIRSTAHNWTTGFMSASPNANPDGLEPKPLKLKYDKRCKSPKSIAAAEGAARSQKQLGRKPNWMKHLSRNKAWEMLDEFDSLASPAEIYAYCWKNKHIDYILRLRGTCGTALKGGLSWPRTQKRKARATRS
jgi:hypothetical protein